MCLKFRKRIIVAVISALIAFSVLPVNAAFEIDDLKKDDRMSFGYSIINGYSKLSEQSGLTSYKKTAVFSSPDLSNPCLLALAGGFYLTNRVDMDRLIKDNGYAMELIKKLNGFLGGMWIKNERAQTLKQELKREGVKILDAYDTVGLYIIEGDRSLAQKLMQGRSADFVFAGGEVPSSMKDMNMDGSSDRADIPLIQRYLTKELHSPDRDIQHYYDFAADINGDKYVDINDVTALQR